MTTYTQEKKEHALSLMAAPHNKPVAEVIKLTGIPRRRYFFVRKQASGSARPSIKTPGLEPGQQRTAKHAFKREKNPARARSGSARPSTKTRYRDQIRGVLQI